jgi:transcriptional regulator NrdR family protein
MRCPRCGFTDTTCVLNIHHRLDGSIRRRHGCRNCQIRWSASELITPGSLTAAAVPQALSAAKSGRRAAADSK